MTPSEIMPDMKFGHWKVIKYDHTNKHRIKYFLCKCEVCGTIKPVRGTDLINGVSTACSKICSQDLVGNNYGQWYVRSRDLSRPGYYICECSCGTIQSVFGASLKNECSKSCGCLKAQKTKQRFEDEARTHIGEHYGLLEIKDCFVKNGGYYFHCQCECGNEVDVSRRHLFNGYTSSCGCINSKANEMMAKILTRYNIPFKREYRFEDCRDKNTLPFDFALFNNEDELIGLIENNGSQHYSARGTQWNTPERLVYTQKHDYIKQQFAENANIPLLIIPYQFFDELEKFLITSDFWQIIIKNFND